MNELRIFENEQFGAVRTLVVKNEPYFVGKDVAEILGYTNPSKALSDHVGKEDKLNNESLSSLGQRGGWLINESGLYSLILSSKLPNAKKFKHWITSEVLPSIRKHGGYIIGQESMTDEELISKALLMAQRKIEERDKRIAEMKPKELFADAVSASNTSILIGDLAKLISQNGIKIGQNRLFEWLRNNGYLIKSGSSRNMPMQRYIEQGLFEVKERNIQNPDGSVRITRTTKVTGKGQIYFVGKFLAKGGNRDEDNRS